VRVELMGGQKGGDRERRKRAVGGKNKNMAGGRTVSRHRAIHFNAFKLQACHAVFPLGCCRMECKDAVCWPT